LNCQTVLTQFQNNNENVVLLNLITIGATNMVNTEHNLIKAKDNIALNAHPFWTHIGIFRPKVHKSDDDDDDGDDDGNDPYRGIKASEDEIDRINSHLDQDCYRMSSCVDQNIVRCADGYTKVGFDRAGCESARPANKVRILVSRRRSLTDHTYRPNMFSPFAARQRQRPSHVHGAAAAWTATVNATAAR
jgi:hypothetical protein